MLVQTENRQYVRDTTNRALLTADVHALARARAQRAAMQRGRNTREELDALRQQVAALTALIETLSTP
jgi:hypothetical protein